MILLKIIKTCLPLAKGLPLAIDVLGCFLYKKSNEEWEDELNKMKKKILKKKLLKYLKYRFWWIEHTEYEIFLHIACFFNMKQKDYIVEILDCLGLHPKIGLKVLSESLC